MVKVSVKTPIGAPAIRIWKRVSSLENVEEYLPMILESKVEGSGVGAKRVCTIPDENDGKAKLEEVVKSFDESAMTFTYEIVSSPLPLENYLGTVKVRELDANNSELEWSCTCTPKGIDEESVEHIIREVYTMAQTGLKNLLED